MRRAKLLMLAYLTTIGVVVAVALVGLAMAPPAQRDLDTYYEAYWNTAQSFDTVKAYDTVSSKMVEQCAEGLYEYAGFGSYDIVPALAAAMPEISEDGRVYTIRLRPNVRYPAARADGTPVEPWRDEPRHVRAEDFVFSFKRIADFHNASNHYGSLMQGRVVGADEFRAETEDRPIDEYCYDELEIAGIRALDPLTLRIELVEPFPQLVNKLAHASTAPKHEAYYRHYAVEVPTREAGGGREIHNRRVMKWRILGTGPYRLTEYQRERHVLFEVNPFYRGRPDVDGAPDGLGGPHPSLAPEEILPRSVRRQAHLFTRESLPRWYNFRLGLYDKIWFIPKDKFAEAIEAGEVSPEMARRGMRQVRVDRPTIEYCAFHLKEEVFRHNRPLRQALSLAIDREEYIRKFRNGDARLPHGLIPPGFATFDEDFVAEIYRFDPVRAAALAEEAKRLHRERFGEALPTLTYTLRSTSAASRARGEFLRLCWRRVGIDVEVQALDFAKWLDETDAKNLEFFSGGWVADYPDEETFFSLFHSAAYEGGSNDTGYFDPEFDALYERARKMPDGPARRELYRRMSRMIERDLPLTLLYYDVRREVYYDWLGRIDLHVYLKAQPMYYELDGALREARLAGRVSGTLEELEQRGEWPPPGRAEAARP